MSNGHIPRIEQNGTSNGSIDMSFPSLRVVKYQNGEIIFCLWSPCEDVLFSSTTLGESIILLPTLDMRLLISEERGIKLISVDWMSDGTMFATAKAGGLIRLHLKDATYLRSIVHTTEILHIKFNPSGTLIAASDKTGKIIIWESTIRNIIKVVSVPSVTKIIEIDWDTEFSFAAAYSNNFSLLFVDVYSTEPPKEFTGHERKVNKITWNPEKTILASCSDDGTIKLWTINQTTRIQEFRVRSKRISELEWLPNGRQLVSWSDDEIIRLWDIERGDCIRSFLDNRTAKNSFALSPDGKFLACCTIQMYFKIFCTDTAQLIRNIKVSSFVQVKWSSSGNQVVVSTTVGKHYLFDVSGLIDYP